jgi:hypothetical protein
MQVVEQTLQEGKQRGFIEYERLIERIATLGQILGSARELKTIFRALRDFAVVSVPCDGMLISAVSQTDTCNASHTTEERPPHAGS